MDLKESETIRASNFLPIIMSSNEPVGPQASHSDEPSMQIVRAKFGIPPYAPSFQPLQFIQTNELAW